MSFPTTLDDFANPSPTTLTNSTTLPLSTAITQLNNAVEAIEAKLGITGSQVSGTVEKRIGDLQSDLSASIANLDAHEKAADPHPAYVLSANIVDVLQQANRDRIEPCPAGRTLVSPPVSGITTSVSANCTINSSAQHTLDGETVWKVTATSVGSSQYFEINVPTQTSFGATDATFEMYLDDVSKLTTITTYIGTSAYAKYIMADQSSLNSPATSRSPRTNGWNAFQISKSMWSKSASLFGLEIGDQLWTNAKIRVGMVQDVSTTVYLRAIRVNCSKIARIAITFDDGYLSAVRVGAPLLAEYGLCSTSAIISSIVGTPGYATLSDLQEYVEMGNCCCPHGPNSTNGSGNLFSLSDDAARLADVETARNYITANALSRNGSQNCYVWPQGVFCASTTDLAFRRTLLDNGFVLGRGTTATMNKFSRVAAMAAHNDNRMVLNIVGHSWSASDEETNIANIISAIQTCAADGYDCILMAHKVVGKDAAAVSTEISTNRLREICAAIQTLVSAGRMIGVLLPDLAR